VTTAVETLFGVRTLTGMLKTFADDSRDKFFRSFFEKGTKSRVDGNTFEWDEVTYSRELAPIIGSSSPAPMTPVTNRVNRVASMVDIKHHCFIPGDRLYRERAPGELKANAQAVVANEINNLRNMIEKTLEWLCVKTLLGSVPISPANVPGSDYTQTLTYTTTAFTKGADWDTAATLIASSEVPTMVDAFTKATGHVPGTVLHNVTVEEQCLQNTEIKTLCANQAYAGRILLSSAKDNRVLDGLRLGNLTWLKSLGYYNLNGVTTRFCPDKTIIVLPEDDLLPQVLGLAEGCGLIPRTAYGAEGDLGIFDVAAPGFYAYCVLSPNPIGIQLFAGWRGLPYLRWPTGIMSGATH